MNDPLPIKTISTKTVYQNPWMRVREDAIIRPDGSEGIYGVMESKDSVVIAAINDQDQIYLIHSFSYPLSIWSWGLPGGGGDDEDPIVAAQRELAEETGITAKKWTLLGKPRVSNGLLTEHVAILVAQDLTHGTRLTADDTELISEGKFFSFDEISDMTLRDEIDDTGSIAAFYLVQRWLQQQLPTRNS